MSQVYNLRHKLKERTPHWRISWQWDELTIIFSISNLLIVISWIANDSIWKLCKCERNCRNLSHFLLSRHCLIVNQQRFTFQNYHEWIFSFCISGNLKLSFWVSLSRTFDLWHKLTAVLMWSCKKYVQHNVTISRNEILMFFVFFCTNSRVNYQL